MLTPFANFSPFGHPRFVAGGGGGGFPIRTNLIMELLAENPYTGGTWDDSSGVGNNATQATSGSRPNNVPADLNGYDTKAFDGSDDFLNLFDPSSMSAATVFIVAKGLDGVEGFWDFDNASGSLSTYYPFIGLIYDSFGSSVRRDAITPAVTLSDWQGRSGVDGVAAFGLEDGTYTVSSRSTAGTLFADVTLTVEGTTTLTITGTAQIIPAPPAASQTTGFVYTRDGQGNLQPYRTLYFQIVSSPSGDLDSYNTTVFPATSDANSLLTVTLEKGAGYRAQRGRSASWVSFTAGSGDTYELPSILGTP